MVRMVNVERLLRDIGIPAVPLPGALRAGNASAIGKNVDRVLIRGEIYLVALVNV